MSPELSPAARAAGQRINNTAGTWKQWRCTICGRTGREIGHRAAREAHLRHYVTNHHDNEVPF